jgi:hypothetical protein
MKLERKHLLYDFQNSRNVDDVVAILNGDQGVADFLIRKEEDMLKPVKK